MNSSLKCNIWKFLDSYLKTADLKFAFINGIIKSFHKCYQLVKNGLRLYL